MRLSHRLLCALLAFLPAAATAQSPDDLEQCRKITGNPDLAIRHCTRAIDSGKLSPPDLARAYASRGNEKAAKHDHTGAIADYDAALRADAGLTDALYSRGIAWANKGEPDRAIADFDAVLKTNPKHADAHHARGTELMVKGDYKRAIEDFDATLTLNPKADDVHFPRGRALFYLADYAAATTQLAKAHQVEPSNYTAMWLFLARSHGGSAEAGTLFERDTRATRDNNWPRGVIALFMGQSDPQRLIKLASSGEAAKRAEQRCEAHFYAAHWHLIRKSPQLARPLLDEAQRSCPKNVLEYEGTLAALRSLKP